MIDKIENLIFKRIYELLKGNDNLTLEVFLKSLKKHKIEDKITCDYVKK